MSAGEGRGRTPAGGAVRAADGEDPQGGGAGPGREDDRESLEPCLRCGVPLRLRQMGCKGGHCPNCGHPYPHGDCSD